MNNIAILGLLITLLWLAAIAYYFYVSRQQREISNELEGLRDMLDEGLNDAAEQADPDGA